MSRAVACALLAAAIAAAASLPSAWAGERQVLATGEEWDLALYATTDFSEQTLELPTGGMSFTLRPTEWAAGAVAIDYADEADFRTGVVPGLGLLAVLSLVGEPADLTGGAQPFLRLSYRAAPGMDVDGSAESDRFSQVVALRAGLRW